MFTWKLLHLKLRSSNWELFRTCIHWAWQKAVEWQIAHEMKHLKTCSRASSSQKKSKLPTRRHFLLPPLINKTLSTTPFNLLPLSPSARHLSSDWVSIPFFQRKGRRMCLTWRKLGWRIIFLAHGHKKNRNLASPTPHGTIGYFPRQMRFNFTIFSN